MTINSLAPILPVRHVGRAIEHYEKLGFRGNPYEEEGPSGPVYGFVCLGPVELHLACISNLDPLTNTSAVYLYVDDADALYARWTEAALGGRFHAPQDTPYGLREFAHVDPDGNLLRVGSDLS